jgi:hypothetical protein
MFAKQYENPGTLSNILSNGMIGFMLDTMDLVMALSFFVHQGNTVFSVSLCLVSFCFALYIYIVSFFFLPVLFIFCFVFKPFCIPSGSSPSFHIWISLPPACKFQGQTV